MILFVPLERCFLNTLELARAIVDVLEDKKGEDILLLDIREVSSIADYFVICTGTSERMLKALADAVLDKVRSEFNYRSRLEGGSQDGWMLVDFGDVILHLMTPERRNYYRLEELWSHGKTILRLQ